jgi:hypothetical protein
MIIGLIGAERSGKDTLAAHLINMYEFERKSFGDTLKEEVWKELHAKDKVTFSCSAGDFEYTKKLVVGKKGLGWNGKDWTGPKSEYGRKLLQYWGDYKREHVDKEYWIKKTLGNSFYKTKNIVVSDCRYMNEINYILNHNGTIVHINREEANNNHTTKFYNKTFRDYPACEIEWRLFLTMYDFTNNCSTGGIDRRFEEFNNYTFDEQFTKHTYREFVATLYENIKNNYKLLPKFNLDDYIKSGFQDKELKWENF